MDDRPKPSQALQRLAEILNAAANLTKGRERPWGRDWHWFAALLDAHQRTGPGRS
ncbi:MAG: hypothetical protein ACM3ZC_03180 [Bacteroidota bacterium]